MIPVSRLGAFTSFAAMVACAVASAAGWHSAVTGAGAVACLVVLVCCLVWLRLRGGPR